MRGEADNHLLSSSGLGMGHVRAHAYRSSSENGTKKNPWIESFWSRFKDVNESKIVTDRPLDELRGGD